MGKGTVIMTVPSAIIALLYCIFVPHLTQNFVSFVSFAPQQGQAIELSADATGVPHLVQNAEFSLSTFPQIVQKRVLLFSGTG